MCVDDIKRQYDGNCDQSEKIYSFVPEEHGSNTLDNLNLDLSANYAFNLVMLNMPRHLKCFTM